MGGCAAYVICTSPRSGSTLLCRMLQATGRSGVPDSHFHEASVTAWLADHGMPVDGYASELDALRAAIQAGKAAGTGETGMFGLRLQRHSFDFLMNKLRKINIGMNSDLSRIGATFGPPRFIYLARSSKLDQAISFLKARQSGLWHRAPDGQEIERLSAPGPVEYDRLAIAAQIARFEDDARNWEAWFAHEGITPLRLGYEVLAQDPHAGLAQVLEFLELPGDLALRLDIPVARLSDEINQTWAARYRAETGVGV